MISQDALIGDNFKGFDRLPVDSMKTTILGPTMFGMLNGQLVVQGDERTQARNSCSVIHPLVSRMVC